MMHIHITPEESSGIQKAIDFCSQQGGGTVILTPGNYLSGTLFLKDHVTLHLEKGAYLLGSLDFSDYPENESCFIDGINEKRGRALVLAYQAVDVGLSGEGVIDGRGKEFSKDHPHYAERPFLVRFVECTKVNISDITLRMAAAWCLHIHDCSDVTVKGISITNRCNENNDGIDIDGCDHVSISDCMIDSGDDALCLKATSEKSCREIKIQNCQVTTNCSAFKIGTESVGDFSNIEVSNCFFYDVKCCAVKIVPVDGGNVDHLFLHDITMKNCTGPVFFSTGNRLRKYFSGCRNVPGQIHHIRMERLYADTVSAKGRILDGKPWGNGLGGIVFSGLLGLPIEDVSIKDCEFYMPGGQMETPSSSVPEMGTQYPEFHLFDPLPCWGIYLRNVKNMEISKVMLHKKAPDVRKIIFEEAVENLSVDLS